MTVPTSFPQPRRKNRPNLGARLETPGKCANGWGVDKQLEGSNLAQTKQIHTHKALQIFRGSAASPPCSPKNALCTGQHCHADRHTYACPKTSSECLGGRGVLPSVVDKHWQPLCRKGNSHTRPPARSRRQLSDEPRGESGHGPLREGGGGAAVAPAAFFVRTTTPQTSKAPASGALTFLGGGCMMLKGHQSSAHPRRRRLKDCEGVGEQSWRKGGGPASQSARALACVSVCERRV